jgi:hypothetical protein
MCEKLSLCLNPWEASKDEEYKAIEKITKVSSSNLHKLCYDCSNGDIT